MAGAGADLDGSAPALGSPVTGGASRGTPGSRRLAGRRPGHGRGKAIGLGLVITYLSVLVLIPLSAVVAQGQSNGWDGFVHGEEAQKIFAENGYRPVVEGADTGGQDFPEPAGLFTIADLGGWADVTTKFFDADKGIVTEIERNLGVSVEK